MTLQTAALFARLSRRLMELGPESPTLQHVADGAVEVVPAAELCGVSLRRRRHRVQTGAATSPLARWCDELQYDLGEGPCVEAVWEDESYLTRDTRTDSRWPRWGPQVADAGVGSVLSIRLATSTETLGAINMYARSHDAFGQDDVDLALIYGVHATNAMSSAQLVTGLQTAMQTRHLIGIAQGVLMERYDLSQDQSFDVLRRYSSDLNVKLRDLAEQVVAGRGLPDPAFARFAAPETGHRSGRDPREP